MDFKALPIPALQREIHPAFETEPFINGLRSFPVLTTSRLRLRPFEQLSTDDASARDVEALHQVLGPVEVHRWNYLFKNGFSLADAESRIENSLLRQAEGLAIGLIVEDRFTSKVVGEIHADFDLSLLAGDIGYATDCRPQNRGKGYATEAARAFIDHLCTIGLQHIVLTAAPDNEASQKVIAKIGVPKIDDVILIVYDADGIKHPRELFYLSATDRVAQ